MKDINDMAENDRDWTDSHRNGGDPDDDDMDQPECEGVVEETLAMVEELYAQLRAHRHVLEERKRVLADVESWIFAPQKEEVC